MSRRASWQWRQVWWPRPFTPEQAFELLERLAADRTMGELVFEARGEKGRITYFVGMRPHHCRSVGYAIKHLVPGVHYAEPKSIARPKVTFTGYMKVSHPSLALDSQRVTAISRAVMAGLASAKEPGEVAVVQVMVSNRLSPQFVPPDTPQPTDHWYQIAYRGVREANTDTRNSLKTRAGSHGFAATIRIGVRGSTVGRTHLLFSATQGGIRVAQNLGVRINFRRESARHLIDVTRPWKWPLHISTRELVPLMGWPVDTDADGHLPGHPERHPILLAPRLTLNEPTTPFAETTAPGIDVQVGIARADSLQHTVLLGPTGSGKSTAMLAMIMDAVRDGRGVLVIDPKTDLVNDVLARIPDGRIGDVVVVDPTSQRPVGINPLAGPMRDAQLRADALLAVFRDLSGDAWGPRTANIIGGALSTLAQVPGTTLTMLPQLLADDAFRRRLCAPLDDHLGLGSFWATFEARSFAQRQQLIDPVMTRVSPYLIRRQIRAVLGQIEPRFRLDQLFTERRIVLVSLNKGLIGAEGARLLGSLVVGQLWPLILRRGSLPPERRRVVSVFIDEVQDYLSLPTDLEDALAQSRGLGVAFTLAHQYRSQLPKTLRSGIDANARNKIIFGLTGEDAREMASLAIDVDAQDFTKLPTFHIYANLMQAGHSTGWFSARTIHSAPPVRDPVEARARSEQTYGRELAEVDADVLDHLGGSAATRRAHQNGPIGRRKTGGAS